MNNVQLMMTNPWFQLLPVFPGQYLIGGAMALYLTCSVGEEGLEPVYNILDLSNWCVAVENGPSIDDLHIQHAALFFSPSSSNW